MSKKSKKKKKVICTVCENELIDPKSPSHIKSGDHQVALKRRRKQNTTSSEVSSSSSAQIIDINLEKRVSNLENMFKHLVQKIDNLELSIIQSSTKTKVVTSDSNLKKQISKSLKTGDNMSIDELVRLSKVKIYPWEVVEQTLLTMIDEEILDISEGSSDLKIENKYGRIIKR